MQFQQHHNWLQRLAIRIAATRWGGWLVLNVTTPIDRLLLRLSGGKLSIGALSGVPTVLLTTTGAKSGKPRTVAVLAMRDGDNLVMIASATGIQRHPAWYYNLRKHPQAEIVGHRLTGTYQAHEAEGEEREQLWQKALNVYPAFDIYKVRASNRRIPVMVLEPIKD